MKEVIVGFTIVIAVVAVIFGGGVYGAYRLDKNRCKVIAADMRTEYRFNFTIGCRLKIGDRFIHTKMLRDYITK